MIVKLLTEHHLEFLSLKGGCTGSSESTLAKMPHYWKAHATAQIFIYNTYLFTWNVAFLKYNKPMLKQNTFNIGFFYILFYIILRHITLAADLL